MRIPYTQEMIEMEEKIRPYRTVNGLKVSISPDAPDEVKEINDKLLEMISELYNQMTMSQ